MCIGHRSATSNKKIKINQGKEIMTLKKTQSSNNLSKFMIITLPISYDNNVLYFLSTYETSFISEPSKMRKKFRSQSIKHNV